MEIERNDIDLLLFCSFRYAIGRSTYLVDDVIALLDKYWDVLTQNTQHTILGEIDVNVSYIRSGDTINTALRANFLEKKSKDEIRDPLQPKAD